MPRRPTKAYVEKLLAYDPDSGVFRWRVDRLGGDGGVRVYAGSIAGYIDSSTGYRKIGIDRKIYYAHRLAVLLMTGRWPQHQVDHENGDRSNLRWENLRPATKAQNMRNKREISNNTSGMRGVHLHRQTGKFQTYITVNKHRVALGFFPTFEEAVAARLAAEAKLFGEFAPK